MQQKSEGLQGILQPDVDEMREDAKSNLEPLLPYFIITQVWKRGVSPKCATAEKSSMRLIGSEADL